MMPFMPHKNNLVIPQNRSFTKKDAIQTITNTACPLWLGITTEVSTSKSRERTKGKQCIDYKRGD
jgi:hypothetical protein